MYKMIATDIYNLLDDFLENDYSDEMSKFCNFAIDNMPNRPDIEEKLLNYGVFQALKDIYYYDIENFGKPCFTYIDSPYEIYDYLYEIILKKILFSLNSFVLYYDYVATIDVITKMQIEIAQKYW